MERDRGWRYHAPAGAEYPAILHSVDDEWEGELVTVSHTSYDIYFFKDNFSSPRESSN